MICGAMGIAKLEGVLASFSNIMEHRSREWVTDPPRKKNTLKYKQKIALS